MANNLDDAKRIGRLMEAALTEELTKSVTQQMLNLSLEPACKHVIMLDLLTLPQREFVGMLLQIVNTTDSQSEGIPLIQIFALTGFVAHLRASIKFHESQQSQQPAQSYEKN